MAITNGARRWYDSSDSDDETPRKESAGVKGKPSPLKQALRNDALSNARTMAVATPDPYDLPEPRARRKHDDDEDDDDDDEDDDDDSSLGAPSPAGPGDTPSPYAHLSRLSRLGGGGGGGGGAGGGGGTTSSSYAQHQSSSHSLLPIPAWSPGLRGRTARNREVLLVARNAREQAKENEFLRTRVHELEEEIAEGSERMMRVRAALDAGERAVEASSGSVRQLEDRLEGAKQREVALKAEAAAHAAAAEQLTLELERMRAIEEQTSLEAAALIQKTSRLQNELNASARQAAIAEEMLAGVQVEGDRALEASEHAMMELQRRLHELEADECNHGGGEEEEEEEEEGGGDDGSSGKKKRRGGGGGGRGGGGSSVAGDLAALLDQAMGEAAALREAVASAASEAGRWRAEASRMEKEHGDTALERSYEAAVGELKELREENAFLRSDLMALHSGMAAEEEAMTMTMTMDVRGEGGEGGGTVGGDASVSAAGDGDSLGDGGKQNSGKFAAGGNGWQQQPGVVVGGGGGGGVGGGVGGGGGMTPAKKGGGVSGRFASPARSSFKKQLQKSSSFASAMSVGGEVLENV